MTTFNKKQVPELDIMDVEQLQLAFCGSCKKCIDDCKKCLYDKSNLVDFTEYIKSKNIEIK